MPNRAASMVLLLAAVSLSPTVGTTTHPVSAGRLSVFTMPAILVSPRARRHKDSRCLVLMHEHARRPSSAAGLEAGREEAEQ
jgi:hypothetical protein